MVSHQYYQDNRERIRACNRAYYYRTREARLAYQKKIYWEDIEVSRLYGRVMRKNSENNREACKRCYYKHHEARLAYAAKRRKMIRAGVWYERLQNDLIDG